MSPPQLKERAKPTPPLLVLKGVKLMSPLYPNDRAKPTPPPNLLQDGANFTSLLPLQDGAKFSPPLHLPERVKPTLPLQLLFDLRPLSFRSRWGPGPRLPIRFRKGQSPLPLIASKLESPRTHDLPAISSHRDRLSLLSQSPLDFSPLRRVGSSRWHSP